MYYLFLHQPLGKQCLGWFEYLKEQKLKTNKENNIKKAENKLEKQSGLGEMS